MSKLFISKKLQLPLEAVTQTFGILAIRGAGKTNTGVVMTEEMLERGQQVVIIDPTGVWWGLRSMADGQKAGFPIVIFGGEHGDLPLHEEDGEMIAAAVIEDRFSVILDLSNFRKRASTRFMTAFAETIYHKQAKSRRPLHLMIDEADSFAPQSNFKGQEQLLGAMEDIVRKGRSRGLGCTMISQRPAVLNKNVLSQIEVLIVLRIIGPQDRDAINYWLEFNTQPDFRRTVLESLSTLGKGEAWVWSPSWLKMFERTQIRMRATFDSSATPTTTDVKPQQVTRAVIDLNALGAKISQAREKAKATDPKLLQGEIVKLKKQVHMLETATAPVAPTIPVEIMTFPTRVAELTDGMVQASQTIYDASQRLNSSARQLKHYCDSLLKHASKLATKSKMTYGPPKVVKVLGETPIPRKMPDAENDPDANDDKPGKGEIKILTALAWYPEANRTRAELGTLAGFTHTGGTFLTYISRLKGRGLIVTEGTDCIRITEAGLQWFGDRPPQTPSSSEEIQGMWLSKLGSSEGEMLKALIEIYPDSFTREELAQRVNKEVTGGSFLTYLSRLRSACLIEESARGGPMKAASSLFIA